MGWLRDGGSESREIGGKSAPTNGSYNFTSTVAKQYGGDSLFDGDMVLININTAMADDLEALPRIGSKLAQSILTHREKNGPFPTARDITAVPGIGDGLYKSIANLITVGPGLL